MTTCGYCGERVDLGGEPHVHDPKRCRDCERELPAMRFSRWLSSADGRRHICIDCEQRERAAKRTTRAVEREQSRQARGERFRQNGYVWMVRTPNGRYLFPAEAERELDQKEWDEHDDYWAEPW